MKIGIVGGGSIGLLCAYYFRKKGAEVTLYTRKPEQAEALLKNGVTCLRNTKKDTVAMYAEDWAEGMYRDDYLLFAVKQYHLPSIMDYILGVTDCERFVFLQNGMSHLSMLENMKQPSAVGIVEHGARKLNATTVEHTGMGSTKIGIVQGNTGHFNSFLHCFHNELFPGTIENDWFAVMINKLIINACINPLTALYGVRNGALLTNPSLHQAMQIVFDEILQAVKVKNREEQWNRVCTVCRNTAHNHSSMLMDIKNGRQTEIDSIIGYILQQANKQHTYVPTLSFLYYSIKGLQKEQQ
ncbi:2-dehydropantoate 2-reductase [Bacillus sp. 165]|uniref:2-dehydropantoate 2-reductase n=1 Tax=Bacillus sp. 165 TaxID=1529117 RepID=UPI001ADD4E40|nr:2-dehydropantoate 2-reductase [Bacillus sp. 165]MBO9130273.1 2-dehydropantoate 2-reductase [Bacillus sp. 165]